MWHQLKDHSYIPALDTVLASVDPNRHPARPDLGLFVAKPSAGYEAAGGTVTRDLFSADDEGFMDDAALVRRLALEKLEQKAAELRSSWAWTRAMLDPEYDFTAQYRRVRPQPVELPPEIAGEIERIGRTSLRSCRKPPRTSVLTGRADHRSRPARGAPLDELAEMAEGLAIYTEKDRAIAGVIVTIGDVDGEFRLHEGLVDHSAIGAEDSGDDETVGFEARAMTTKPLSLSEHRTGNAQGVRFPASCWSTI